MDNFALGINGGSLPVCSYYLGPLDYFASMRLSLIRPWLGKNAGVELVGKLSCTFSAL